MQYTVSVKSVFNSSGEPRKLRSVPFAEEDPQKPHPPPNRALELVGVVPEGEKWEAFIRIWGDLQFTQWETQTLLSGGQTAVCLVCMNSQKHDNQ